MQIIKAIESMNQWTSHVMTSWVEYHIHRSTVLNMPRPLKSQHCYILFSQRSQLKGGLDMRGLQEASRDDLCQALALWDIKQVMMLMFQIIKQVIMLMFQIIKQVMMARFQIGVK